ncbi:HK97 family phage prohead protease [Sphingobium yanoikuyae]|mgnify:CR=1 FL=1|uniref:HK97 family phage prohead protease n=1 Tax=Sphingobium yanoikuyae TaxID=13690 RepID=UPI0024304DFB|nr:HK97 family phage prohead protease [Sphingobium yanoikuyae]
MEYAASSFDIKSLDDSGHIEGLLAGFGNVDEGGDRLMPGTFTKTLANRSTPLPMLLHHDSHRPIGAWKEWQERKDGLYVKGRLTLSTRDAQEAHALAKDGALTGLSIGWKPRKGATDRSGVRTITEAELFEGSLVALPMNNRTRITSVKSITNAKDIADLLQEAGISSRRAKLAAGAAWKAINQEDREAKARKALAEQLQQITARLG